MLNKNNDCRFDCCRNQEHRNGLCPRHYRISRGQKARDVWDWVKVGSAHRRVRNLWGSATRYPCMECGRQAKEWAYDGTDPTQRYERERPDRDVWVFFSRFPEFYMPMCSGCHRRRDCAKAKAELHAYRLTLSD